MSFHIPCAPGGAASWTQQTPLEGRYYQLTFDWHARTGVWKLDLADADGTPIRSGIALLLNVSLLAGLVDPRRPPGALVVVDTTGAEDADPGFDTLGGRFKLVYFTAAELA